MQRVLHVIRAFFLDIMPCLICEEARVISVIILIRNYYPKEVNHTLTVLSVRSKSILAPAGTGMSVN